MKRKNENTLDDDKTVFKFINKKTDKTDDEDEIKRTSYYIFDKEDKDRIKLTIKIIDNKMFSTKIKLVEGDKNLYENSKHDIIRYLLKNNIKLMLGDMHNVYVLI
nr:unknown [Darna trima granulovirus]